MKRSLQWFLRQIGIMAFISVCLLWIMIEGSGEIITVDDDGGGADHTSIQDAINASGDGDTIHVYEGEYQEQIVVNKRLDIFGLGGTLPVINGTGHGDILTIRSDWVNLSGFNVTRSDYIALCKGMIVKANNVTLSQNTIYSNYYGIHLDQGSCFNTIIGNHFSGSNNAALKLDEDADYNTLLNNTFIEGASLSLEFSDHNIIDGNVFIRNRGLELYYSHFNKIGNTTCTYGYGFSTNGASYNTIFNLTCNWTEGSGAVLKSGEENTLTNIICTNNKECGLKLDTERGSTFNILNCSGNELDGIRVIDRGHGNTFSRVISIENGGIGFSCESSSDIVLYDSNFSLNGDSGLQFISSDRPVISACIVLENHVAGLWMNECDDTMIMDNTISWNTVEGMYLEECDGNEIVNNTCLRNQRGMYIVSSHETTFISNVCNHNEETGVYLGSTFYEITNNTCDFNGEDGFYLRNGGHTISGNSFSHNGRTGLFLYRSNSNLITDNILSYNERGLRVTGASGQYSKHNNAHDNEIAFNTAFGVDVSGNDDNEINATDNWWGHTSGPYHPESNPGGQGDNVTDHAPFDPWTGKPTPVHNLDRGIDYFSIQEGIDDAIDGETITVDPGEYEEILTIDRELILQGSGPEDTIIVAGITVSDPLIHLIADSITFNGFAIIGNASLDPCVGILVESDYNKIEDNRIINCTISIHLRASSTSTLSGNEMGSGGIFVEGGEQKHWRTLNIDSSNTLNGDPVYCYRNEDGIVVPADAGQVILGNCQNMLVRDLKISSVYCGIQIGFTTSTTIENNTVRKCQFGITITSQSADNQVRNNTCENNSFAGILLRYAGGNNSVLDNKCFNSLLYGISVDNYCDDNLVSKNICWNNSAAGIHVDASGDGNLISLNSCQYNDCGIQLRGGENRADGNALSFNIKSGLQIRGRSIGSNNSCRNNQLYGIEVSFSSDTILENNTCINNPDSGISLWQSSHCILFQNVMEQNEYGLKIMGYSNKNIMRNCEFMQNDVDVKFGDSQYNRMENCHFKAGSGPIELRSYSTDNEIHFSNILVNIDNWPDSPLNATHNWWGSSSGKKETSELHTKPWLKYPFDYALPEAVILACPTEVIEGEPVVLSAGGSVYQQVISYKWSTNMSGELYNGTTSTIIITDPVAVGVHEVTLRVLDNFGSWSDPVITYLHVINSTFPPSPDHLPFITVISPTNQSTIYGMVNVTGTAFMENGSIVLVEISIDDQEWREIIGYEEWHYQLNTEQLLNGTHTIKFRAYDGIHFSRVICLTVTIENNPGENQPPQTPDTPKNEETDSFIPSFPTTHLFVAFFGVSSMISIRKRVMGISSKTS